MTAPNPIMTADQYLERADQIFKGFGNFDPKGKSVEELTAAILPGLASAVVPGKTAEDIARKSAQTLYEKINGGNLNQQKVAKYYLAHALFISEFLKRAGQSANASQDRPLCQKMVRAIPPSSGNPIPDLERYKMFGDVFRPLTQLNDRNRLTGFGIWMRAEKDISSCEHFIGFFGAEQAKQDWTRFFDGVMNCFKDDASFGSCTRFASVSPSPAGKK